ncbi:MAG: class I SAM-dependent methyltransferase [Candidatus Aenigmarchaeota archaeon]|nr:class I SAM-dependent methyltransferase [Candidatus Aenigmarchaeota archaeon]
MVRPVYVRRTVERKRVYNGGISIGSPFLLEEDTDPKKILWKEITKGKSEFTFPSMRSEGYRLFFELGQAIQNGDAKLSRRIYQRMQQFMIKNYNEKTDREKWKSTAEQLPTDIGGYNKREKTKLITSHARGRVLEAMCGFNTYFNDSPEIEEVVAFDYSRAMLERYPRPERTRILFDVNKIPKGKRMDFFEDGHFNTIGCFWGTNYMDEMVPVFKEFWRLLSKGGNFIVFENTYSGYGDLVRRYFNPDEVAAIMTVAGFRPEVERVDSVKEEVEMGDYYLVEGKK